MKRRFGIGLLYVLAAVVISGRIGSAMGSPHPWAEFIKLYPVTTAEAWGEDFESLVEDLIVFAAAWHVWRLAQNFIRHKRTAGKCLRLNGWQHIGIVASVLWALYGFYQGNEYGLHQSDWAVDVQKSCWAEPAANLSLCDAQFTRNWEAAIQYHWEYALIYSLVPILLGWLLVYGLMKLIIWVKRGFTSPAQGP